MKQLLKNALRPFIRKLVDEEIRDALLLPLPLPHGDSLWFASPNLWELAVQIALRDLAKPGGVVFDVGANFGGLTSLLSRMVGPRGIVCSFEASPRIVGILQANVVKHGHRNVTVYHNAVYSVSNKLVPIYAGDHLNDSIFKSPSSDAAPVFYAQTLSLDDFAEATGLVPNLIKMDIEGAEFDALKGATKLIAAHSPHLILEQQPEDTRCLEFLQSRGYRAIDLNSYREVRATADFPEGSTIRNVLFVHSTRMTEVPYAFPPKLAIVDQYDQADFERRGGNVTSSSKELGPGRYLMEMRFVAQGTDNSLMAGVRADGITIFRYHAYSKLLAETYRDWVFDLTRPAKIEIFFEFQERSSDDTFRVTGATLNRLAGFSPDPMPYLVAP